MLDGFGEGGFEEVVAAFEDAAVAGDYVADGGFGGDGFEQALDAGFGGGAVPGAEVGQGEEPRSPASDMGFAAHGAEGVADVEGAVAFVEEAEVAGSVAGGGEAAEGAVEFSVGDGVRGGGDGSGEAALDLALGLVAVEGEVLRGGLGEQAGVAGADGDVDGAEEVGELVEGADVVSVSVGEEDAGDGSAEGAGGVEDGCGGAGDAGVDEGEGVGLADEVGVD